MNQNSLGGLKRIAVLIIPLLMLIGCGAASSPVQPTVTPPQADVTAIEIPVYISKANNAETTLKKDETVEIQVNDSIVVPEGGHAVLRFADRLVVDILRNSEYRLSDVKLEPDNAMFVTLRQVKGQSRVTLSDNANARVRLETDFGTITTLRAGTEFLVSHDPTLLTDLEVRRGEVEVVAQGKVVTLSAPK